MALKWNAKALSAQILKYKYPIIVLVIGLLLMAIPSFQSRDKPASTEQIVNDNQTLETHLNHVLSKVDGAGAVEVLLTKATGEETIYQTDLNNTNGTESGSTNAKTVTVTNSQRDQTGLVRQVIPPTYQGAIVVCQGADIPTVKYAIVDAVSKVTGLGVNQISVLKMK